MAVRGEEHAVCDRLSGHKLVTSSTSTYGADVDRELADTPQRNDAMDLLYAAAEQQTESREIIACVC
jgi:hypothetical protein